MGAYFDEGDSIPFSKIHALNPGGHVNTSLKTGLESFWANLIFFLALQQTVHISYNITYRSEESIKFLLMNIPAVICSLNLCSLGVQILSFLVNTCTACNISPTGCPNCHIMAPWGSAVSTLLCPAGHWRDTDTWTRNQRPPQLSLFHNWGGRWDKKEGPFPMMNIANF